MANQLIQLGVVGCGWAGRQAINAANATSRLNVIAIAERDPVRRAEAGDENAVPHRYADYHELLDDQLLKPFISLPVQMVGCSKSWIRLVQVNMS